jgi:hypothetical protein
LATTSAIAFLLVSSRLPLYLKYTSLRHYFQWVLLIATSPSPSTHCCDPTDNLSKCTKRTRHL